MARDGEGFAARWSKRKVEARREDETEPAENHASLPDAGNLKPGSNGETSGNEMLTDADFEDVDFDKLDKSSDYTRFIKANVPAAIQKKALRKLWASDSVFEVLDGMNDYDEDFTGDGLAGKLFKTAHKVGRGFITDEDDEKWAQARAEQAKAEKEEAELAKTDQAETDDDDDASEISDEVELDEVELEEVAELDEDNENQVENEIGRAHV